MHPAVPALFLLLTACTPICSGTAIGADLVITTQHCTGHSLQVTRARIQRPDVALGDTLTIVAAAGCTGPRSGRVVALAAGLVVLDTYACPGNSGAPTFDASGRLVGVVVRRRASDGAAIVELL